MADADAVGGIVRANAVLGTDDADAMGASLGALVDALDKDATPLLDDPVGGQPVDNVSLSSSPAHHTSVAGHPEGESASIREHRSPSVGAEAPGSVPPPPVWGGSHWTLGVTVDP